MIKIRRGIIIDLLTIIQTSTEMTDNDLQNITQKTKDRPTRTLLTLGGISGAPEGLAVPAPHATPFVLPLNDTNIVRNEKCAGHQYT